MELRLAVACIVMSQSDFGDEYLHSRVRVKGFPPWNTQMKSPGRCARELTACGLVSGLADLVEYIESWELNVEIVGSRVGKSLLGCTVMTLEKRLRPLAERGPMSRFHES